MKSLSKTDIEQLPFLWSHGIAARETLKYLDRKGIDATPPLADAGLSRNQLTRKPGGVSAASQHRFLEVAADQADDPLLGLHIAAEMDLRDIGLLYYLQASSATVSDALKRLARYAATASEEISLEIAISHHEGEALLTFRRMLPIGGPCRQHSELIALAFNRVLRVLTNRDFLLGRSGLASISRSCSSGSRSGRAAAVPRPSDARHRCTGRRSRRSARSPSARVVGASRPGSS